MYCSKVVASIGLIIDIMGAILIAKDLWKPPLISEYEKKPGFLTLWGKAIESMNRLKITRMSVVD